MVIKNVENTNPQSFKDIKVFAAGPYNYPVSDTTYRNLIWETEGETEGKNINTWYLREGLKKKRKKNVEFSTS